MNAYRCFLICLATINLAVKDLKNIVESEVVDVFDHATVFNKNTPHIELAKELESRGPNVLLVNYQPTINLFLSITMGKFLSCCSSFPRLIILHQLILIILMRK